MKVEGNVFAVTGAASGLGAATAKALGAKGAQVVLMDRNIAAAHDVAAEIGANAQAVEVDVTNPAQVDAALDLATSDGKSLRGIVCCAGVGAAARITGKRGPHDLDAFRFVVEVNLIGTFNCLRLAATRMVANEPDGQKERGVMIATASIAAYDGQIGQVAYSASKGGIVAMTLPIARDLASTGIRMATIAPGLFDTPLLAALPEEAREALGKQVPFPSRLGNPTEFAALATHIVENPMLNGEVIRLDGALRMPPR